MVIGWVIGGIIVVAVGYVALSYNGFITLKNRIDNAWAQIDVQLKRRADLIPNLVESVKGYMKHEKDVLKGVTEARSALQKAKSTQQKARASNMMTDALKTLFAVSEAYPKLQANQNFLMLQEELSGTESKIAYSRQFYNDSVLAFNTKVERFPSNLIAKAFGFTKRQFFEADESERKAVKVSF